MVSSAWAVMASLVVLARVMVAWGVEMVSSAWAVMASLVVEMVSSAWAVLARVMASSAVVVEVAWVVVASSSWRVEGVGVSQRAVEWR